MVREQPSVFWVSAFLDLPGDTFEATVGFWEGVTGFERSAPRGEHGEFATLVPPASLGGDDYLRVQRLGGGPARIHLDLHVEDPARAAARAVGLGASEVARPDGPDGYVVLVSPGGLGFCFVSHPAAVVPAPAAWPRVRRSRVYQVCLDIPSASYDAESAFWSALTGRPVDVLARRPEFAWLRGDGSLALGLLLQRLDEPDGVVRAHLDVGTPDRGAEVERHLALGARVLATDEFWTVLADPAGVAYCVTDRDPASGEI